MQTKCYTSMHLVTVIFVLLLFVVYTVGFPCWAFVLLMRSFADEHTKGLLGALWRRYPFLRARVALITLNPQATKSDEMDDEELMNNPLHTAQVDVELTDMQAESRLSHATRQVAPSVPVSKPKPKTPEQEAAEAAAVLRFSREESFGFLFMRYRASAFETVVSAVFVVQLLVALVTVYVDEERNKALQLFLFGLVWFGQSFGVVLQLPFQTFFANARKSLIGLGAMAHSTVLLAAQTGGTESAYLYLMLLASAALLGALLLRTKPYVARCLVATPEQEAIEAYEAAQEAEAAAATAKEQPAVKAGNFEVAVEEIGQVQAAAVEAESVEDAAPVEIELADMRRPELPPLLASPSAAAAPAPEPVEEEQAAATPEDPEVYSSQLPAAPLRPLPVPRSRRSDDPDDFGEINPKAREQAWKRRQTRTGFF